MIRDNLKGLFLIVISIIFSSAPFYASTGYEKEIDAISKIMTDKIAAAGKKKVAVVDFTDLQGSVTELGRFLAEEFSVSLASAGKGFIVVDRTHLKTILKEHKLSSKGLIDPTTARKLGKIAGVEALVTGTLTPLGESVRISVKILDTETAAVIEANRGNIPMTNAIRELMQREVGSPTGPKPPGYKKRKPGKSQQRLEEEGITFELMSCKVSGRTVTCTIMITNNAEDTIFKIRGDSIMYEDLGNGYWVKSAQIANSIRDFNSSGIGYWLVEKDLLSGVPTKTILTFQGLDPKAAMITVLRMLYVLGDKHYYVKFADIPLAR